MNKINLSEFKKSERKILMERQADSETDSETDRQMSPPAYLAKTCHCVTVHCLSVGLLVGLAAISYNLAMQSEHGSQVEIIQCASAIVHMAFLDAFKHLYERCPLVCGSVSLSGVSQISRKWSPEDNKTENP